MPRRGKGKRKPDPTTPVAATDPPTLGESNAQVCSNRKRRSSVSKGKDGENGGSAQAVNSNWMQLQATLETTEKNHGASSRKKAKPNSQATLDQNAVGGAKGNGLAAFSSIHQPTSDDTSLTKVLAMDCEMVGVGFEGKRNALARVSLVNRWGNVVYDKHVRPSEFVTDFRTAVSGVRPGDLRKAEKLWTVQGEVGELLKGRILVGHALHNDLKVLLLSHARKHMRDTHNYPPFCNNGRPRSLRHLAALHLGCQIQDGEHDSVEDARAAMALYLLVKEEWEQSFRHRSDEDTDKQLGSMRKETVN